MRINGDSAHVMRRLSQGPVLLAEKEHRRRHGTPGQRTREAAVIIAGRAGPQTLKGFGASGETTEVASGAVGAGAKVGGTALATYAGAGSWAGPIGIAAGLIIGIVVTKLLTKNYFNVNQMNQIRETELNVFQQYQKIMGKFPGRAVGLPVMTEIWKGANKARFFPKNNLSPCFHNGCAVLLGDDTPIDQMVVAPNAGGIVNSIAAAYALQQAHHGTPAATSSSRQIVPVSGGRAALAGLGCGCSNGFGAVATPDVVDLITNYFAPLQVSACAGSPYATCTWAAPANATERQVLYDVADAWLAQYTSNPPAPYIAIPSPPAVPVPTSTHPNAPTTPAPTPVVQPVTVNNQPATAVTDPTTGATTYVNSSGGTVTPTGPVTPLPTSAIPGGLSSLPWWAWLAIGGGVLLILRK